MPKLGSGGGGTTQGMDDLSGLVSLPLCHVVCLVHEVSLSTWSNTSPPFFNPNLIVVYTFKHRGHAHHLCAWFEKACLLCSFWLRLQLSAGWNHKTHSTWSVYRGPRIKYELHFRRVDNAHIIDTMSKHFQRV